jgi:nicotinate dehydrogenase subunit B
MPEGLFVARQACETLIHIRTDGKTTAFCGHVDLGTGISTALAQIVADELDVAFDSVNMVLGDIGTGPNQGATIASDTIQTSAVPLRQAAAQARAHLVALAAERFGRPPEELRTENGEVRGPESLQLVAGYGELLAGKNIVLPLDTSVKLKPPGAYRLVGRSQPRVDIPAKATGQFSYVHDVRLPGMLHGRVIRPPYAGRDSGDFAGRSLISVDKPSIADLPGIVAVVVIGDFVGVVAEREEVADKAATRLKTVWKTPPRLPDLADPERALRANPSTPRRLIEKGDVPTALNATSQRLRRSYVWPYQMHASIGPSCSVADWNNEKLTVWSGTQNPHELCRDLAKLLDLPPDSVNVIRFEAAGCYGRNCADDVGGDAALLARATGRPVRVQLTRDQEHAWEPKGAAQLIDIDGGLKEDGGIVYDFATRYPSNGAPLLALLLTQKIAPTPAVFEMGDRTAIPPYAYDALRVTVHDMAPIVRASWLRGVSALPNSFAHECYIDELASAAGEDPVAYRLRHLPDPRAADMIRAVAEKAQWQPGPAPRGVADGNWLHGRGFAYALYIHSKFPGHAAAWSAWVADVSVNRNTGEVAVTRVVVGQDTGMMANPAGVAHQIEGNVIQSTSRALMEQVAFSDSAVISRDWGGYPILTFPDVPKIELVLMPRQDQPPLGAGESASVPSAAAIANAIFDATGVRFREPPFTPEKILAGLRRQTPKPPKKRRRFALRFSALSLAFCSFAAIGLPMRQAIAPIDPPQPGVFSAATLARGKTLALLGDCAVCHTAQGGAQNAGGRALQTPFGTIVTTNITPDPDTGIGAWSYPAFERAMREGIHRDGKHLYPAFPYTAYAMVTDADLQALYAYLMAQTPVRSTIAPSRLIFPFNLRPLMAGWNALFHRATEFTPDPRQSPLWNRGAYLVQGLGHCGACHTPRNLLGAESKSALSGGFADGWHAPALTAASSAPVPWTEEEFYTYLRTGFSRFHGVAAGPMASVVAQLRDVPEDELRAMAHYLASLNPAAPRQPVLADLAEKAETAANEAASSAAKMEPSGKRFFDGACKVCHEGGNTPWLYGIRPSLALNSTLHATRPDNLIRVILEGIDGHANPQLGLMPGFAASMDDAQAASLLRYLRARFAPNRAPWTGLEAHISRIRVPGR